MTRDTLAVRVSARLNRQANQARNRGKSLPEVISSTTLLYLEEGRKLKDRKERVEQTCRKSVLTNLAVVLDVDKEFLTGDSPSFSVKVHLPGLKTPAQFIMDNCGIMEEPEDETEPMRTLASAWLSLSKWRSLLLEDYDTDEGEEGDELEDLFQFVEHMSAALRILLAPIERVVKDENGLPIRQREYSLREYGVQELFELLTTAR